MKHDKRRARFYHICPSRRAHAVKVARAFDVPLMMLARPHGLRRG